MRRVSTLADMSQTKLFAVSVLAGALALVGCATSGGSSKVVLFDGKDLSGWQSPTGKWMTASSVSLKPSNPHFFQIEPGQGLLVNGNDGRTANLKSVFQHGDCQAHIEFCVSSNSNSGVYLQGRYEIQILDSWGVEHPNYGDCGGIYHRWKDNKGYEGEGPRVNASKPPGQWQTFDVTFRAPRFDATGKKVENVRFVKVVHNGVVVHENTELTGPTRGPMAEDEKPTGPIMLQGDHGPVAYRNLWVKPLHLK